MCIFVCGVLRFGTERLYAQKEDLLHEVLELEAEKGLLASGEGAKYQVGVNGVRKLNGLYKSNIQLCAAIPLCCQQYYLEALFLAKR